MDKRSFWCWARSLSLIVCFLLLSGLRNVAAAQLGFYYGHQLNAADWQPFEQLVVQPSHVSEYQLQQLKKLGIRPVAYLSLGEIANAHPLQKTIPRQWLLNGNQEWQSRLLDLRLAEVQQWMLQHRLQPLLEKGFDGVFLDTLDSFHRLPQATHDDFRRSIVRLIAQMRQQLGNQRVLWVNRGFDMLDGLAPQINGVVFESLFRGYRNARQAYEKVDDESRQWLLHQVDLVLQRGLPVVAIDYLPDQLAAQSLAVAKSISGYGIQPYITDGHLTRIGTTLEQPQPRQILALVDEPVDSIDRSKAHLYATTPLEYLGYQVSYRSMKQSFLTDSLTHRYAGILVWSENNLLSKRWCPWLRQQAEHGLKIVFLGMLPAHPDCAWVASVNSSRRSVNGSLELVAKADSVGEFEAPLILRRVGLQSVSVSGQAQPWLTLKSAEQGELHPIATTARGGYAVTPYVLQTHDGQLPLWMFDPFKFFKQAFELPEIPVIDVSTESGRRILLAHIDGDGFVSKAELKNTPLAAEVIWQQIIRRYKVPHTVSIIEAEVSPQGVYPETSRQAEYLARQIFKEPNVEIASHTYSHPYFWRVLDGIAPARVKQYGTHLPIQDYQLNVTREIAGSLNYINQQLAPENKRTKVLLWSGDARPGDKAVSLTEQQGVWNVNGGNTKVLPYQNSLTQVWPVGLPKAYGVQIYAPVMNENVYTNEWTGPFYGYRQVVDTFKLLESPRRLKPVNLYYHFYSGTKPEALEALHHAYRWALEQPLLPMYLSEYASRASAFYQARLTQNVDGEWRLYSSYPVRTLRLSAEHPELISDDIAGSKLHSNVRYHHVASSSPIRWRHATGSNSESAIALTAATIVLDRWQWETRNEKQAVANFDYHSWTRPELEFRGATQCTVTAQGKSLDFDGNGAVRVTLPWERVEGVRIACTR